MVVRKISTRRYILAALITMLFFMLGLVSGILFDNLRVTEYESRIRNQEIDLNSIQLQYLYLSEMISSEDACPSLRIALQKSVEKLGESLDQIQSVMNENKNNIEDKERIERIYIQDNIRYWIFSRRIREMCNNDVINILYFYSDKCDICPDQGVILSYFKKKYQDNILIFPINVDVNDYMIEMLKLRYNVTEYPTIVINADSYRGITYKQELGKIICEEFIDKSKCSAEYPEE